MAVATGERRIVTVLFADIVGSTAMAEQLGPERSKLVVDEVMRLIGAEVERYDGTVAQYIGDELYAVFGAPQSHEDDSERAVLAALAILRAVERYDEEVSEAYGVSLAVRVAINTGPVVIQPESDDPYNALGETVNVAARIQQTAEPGDVVIGAATRAHVGTCFELAALGPRELKGVSTPVEIYRVLGAATGGVQRPHGPLLGRDFEITVLERTFDALVEGRGSVVAVIGEPGIGKTRLVADVRERYTDRIRFVDGRAVSYAQGFAYFAIRDLLREWLGAAATTPEARVRLELKAALAGVFGEEAEDAYPFVGSLLGIALEPAAAERLQELNRESVQTRTFEVVTELVCRLAVETPLCLVLDDLHWADESSLDLLEHLLAVTDRAAVTVVLLYRTEREHRAWRLGELARQRYPHRYREIALQPLPGDASRALATAFAGGALPPPVLEVLTDRAGGNPYFLEEALRDLIERGSLERHDGRFELAVDVDRLVVPALVQGALQARLDRLDPASRQVLSAAAVIGRTFGLPLLEELLPPATVARALSELQRLDLVVEVRRRPVVEYRFRHGLVQEVAYASLVESRRRRSHLEVGEALERLSGHLPGQHDALLARHFSEAEEPNKAAEYLLRAGDAARAVYAEQEAVAHYERARVFLARLGEDARVRETLFKIALARHLAFDFPRAEDAYDAAFCCGVEEPVQLVPVERLVTAVGGIADKPLVPGHVYSTEATTVAAHLFRGLLAVDRDMNVIPALADNMRVSADGTTYLFRLRDGARWSDGVPVTASDFAWTWEQIREEEAATAFLLEGVEARAIDDRTLEVRLDRPRSSFPYALASVWSYPWPRHVCESVGPDWCRSGPLVGNGPYTLEERTETHLTLVANPNYSGPRGNVREIVVSISGTEREHLARWQEGDLDVLTTGRPVGELDATEWSASSGLGMTMVGFNARLEPFANELVRRAVAHALDSVRVARELDTVSTPVVRGGAIPPAMPGHSSVGIPPDLDEAHRLLEEAGYEGGSGLPRLRLLVQTSRHGEVFGEILRELGARVEVEVAGETILPPDVQDVHLWVSGWLADYPDPEGLFQGLFKTGYPLAADDRVTELLDQTRHERSQDARMALFHEIDRVWVGSRAAIVPVLYNRSLLLRRPWVEGVWANPLWGIVLDTAVVRRPG